MQRGLAAAAAAASGGGDRYGGGWKGAVAADDLQEFGILFAADIYSYIFRTFSSQPSAISWRFLFVLYVPKSPPYTNIRSYGSRLQGRKQKTSNIVRLRAMAKKGG